MTDLIMQNQLHSKVLCVGLSIENPVSEEQDYKLEALVAVQQLVRLDKDKFSNEEKEEAERIREERQKEEMLQVCSGLDMSIKV